MVSVVPIAVAIGFAACLGLIFFSFWASVSEWFDKFARRFEGLIDKADLKIKPRDFLFTILALGSLIWVVFCLLLRADSLTGILLLPLSLALCFVAGNIYLKRRGNKRVSSFIQQLENVLRMMAGALRVGLGLRQSLILVTEEISDPARREFLRVIGRTNIGISILDALDELSTSMPGQEMKMMARSIRVQATTGGDLGQVLETLATTIKERRKILRKVAVLTAQGRGAAWIIGALPLVVGGFILFTQPEMSHAMLQTQPGWGALGLFCFLEGLAIFSLMKILTFDG
ncbi:MAG TPA: type II secretion system F family protein [Candidatus Baltobacteraceae bacterium]|jgi:tight adherence protein B|nr:type II secretion system F family protein [Candidatus Baltobacteraceae bacterium]